MASLTPMIGGKHRISCVYKAIDMFPDIVQELLSIKSLTIDHRQLIDGDREIVHIDYRTVCVIYILESIGIFALPFGRSIALQTPVAQQRSINPPLKKTIDASSLFKFG